MKYICGEMKAERIEMKNIKKTTRIRSTGSAHIQLNNIYVKIVCVQWGNY